MRAKLTVSIPAEVLDRARAAAVGMQRMNPAYSLSQLVEEAVRAHVDRLERAHHEGRAWEPPSAPLRRGRRIEERDREEGSPDRA